MRPARMAAALLLLGCQSAPVTRSEPSATPAAALASLADDYWEWRMREFPTSATRNGDHRYDDRLMDIGPEARLARLRDLRAFRERLRALLADKLAEPDRVTSDVLRVTLDLEIEEPDHHFWQWSVDQMFGPQVSFFQLLTFHPTKTEQDIENLAARFEAFPRHLDQYGRNLAEGLRAKRVPPRVAVERVIAQIRRHVERGAEKSPLAEAIERIPAETPAARREALAARLRSGLAGCVLPALARLGDFLEWELLPASRTEPGVCHIPGGREAYAFRIRQHTRDGLTPEELHRVGREELASIRKEMEAIVARAGPSGKTGDLAGYQESVEKDPRNFYDSREAVLDDARRLLEEATAKLPKFFGKLPKTPCVVKPIEEYREKDAVAAFYESPPDDLSRPGVYWSNTYEPGTRSRVNMPALTVHEAVPGHHLQLALATEAKGLPAFRRHGGFTAFVEGWGLYSERLADEMGMYKSDLDRFGMLTFQAWRATRLVVDTGLHAMGWTRDQALAVMKDNLAISDAEIENELDRYIIWPGQALAYKVGQREIQALRAEAEKALGAKFDLRAFHDAVLANGAIPLETLRTAVRRWIEKARQRG